MSVVEITNHNEVIYTILDKPPPEPPKTPRYLLKVSLNLLPNRDQIVKVLGQSVALGVEGNLNIGRYESKLEKELKEAKRPQLRRTFGYAETPLKAPDQFLKKGQGIGQPVKKTDHKCYVSGNLPPVPKRPPPGKKEEKPTVNFRVINIKKAIKTKGKPVEPRLVDTRDGHIKKIKGSGEVPEFCLRPDFGQMPAYLVKRNRRIQKAIDKIRYAEENKESLCKLISAEDRQSLLDDLKHNWSLMQKAFLQLPMLTDTIPKILRKTKMEQELRQLEKDIALVESNPYIYIYE